MAKSELPNNKRVLSPDTIRKDKLNEDSTQPSSTVDASNATTEATDSALPDAVPPTDSTQKSHTETTDSERDYTIVQGNSGKIYRVYNIIGKGGYGVVHKAAYKDEDGRFVLLAIKSERTESLEHEAKIIRKMHNAVHFCILFDEGFDPFSKSKFIVMNLVGENLSDYRRLFNWFSWGTVLRVGLQTLHAIQELHTAGFLSRDIKPSNFAVGSPDALRRLVYMLDFGIARTYVGPDGSPLPSRGRVSFHGTSRYCSLPQHYGKDHSRRDDIESWFYMLVELTTGKLPWAHYNRTEKAKIAEAKRRARTVDRKSFLAQCPRAYQIIMEVIDRWEFETVPDYDGLMVLLDRVLSVIGIAYTDTYDWEHTAKYKAVPPRHYVSSQPPRIDDHCTYCDENNLEAKLISSKNNKKV